MNYLIVIEIEELGFVYASPVEAEKIIDQLNEIFLVNQEYNFSMMDKIENLKLIEKYNIKGNQLFFNKNILGMGNGFASIYLIEVNSKFCLKSFIKERENSSIPFDDDNFIDEYYSILENYPDKIILAN